MTAVGILLNSSYDLKFHSFHSIVRSVNFRKQLTDDGIQYVLIPEISSVQQIDYIRLFQ